MPRKCYLSVFPLILLALVLFSCTKRKPEEIDYAPNSPWNPYPPDSSTNIDHTTLDVTLRWTATDPNSGDVMTYDLYFDTLNPPSTQIASGLSASNYFMTGLSYNTTYYWKLYITDDKGVTTCGPVWRFTTLPHANSAPNVPAYLYPADNTAWEYPTLNFDATCSDPEGITDTLHYDLYLGVTTLLPVIPYKSDLESFREISGLNYTTTYYWKVVVHDNHYAYTSGPLYSFTTRDCPWFYKSELPSPRYGFGTAVVNNKIYVIGGTDGTNYLSEVLEYDPLLDTWTRKAGMPTARSNLAVTVSNGKIYAIGGSNSIYDLKNSNESYDPALDAWTSLTPAPASHYWSTANAVDSSICFIGSTPVLGGIFSGIYQYSVSGDKWWHTTTYSQDTLWTDSTCTTIDTIITDSVRNYLKSTLPEGRLFHCSSAYNGQIYIMGGTTKSGVFPAGVDAYHPETNTWSIARDMIGPASAPAATVANECIYVVGGYDGTDSRRVRKYDPGSDTWVIRSDLQKERSFLGGVFIANCIYAIGGLSVVPLATVEEYQLELDPKNKIKQPYLARRKK